MAQLSLTQRLGQSFAVLAGRAQLAEPAKPTGGQISRPYDGIGQGALWLAQLALNDDNILALEGGGDLSIYQRVLDDDKVFSAFQQRRMAVLARPWIVDAGAEDALSKRAAEHLKKTLDATNWDDASDKMLYTRWFGYGVGELVYKLDDEQLVGLEKIVVPDRRWFAFNNAGELRMRTPQVYEGVPVPERKFWVAKAGGHHDFLPYGMGLAHWCYWPVWFKNNGINFWSLFLEKFGMPTALGKFPQAASDEDRARLLDALKAISTDSSIIIPDGMEAELLEAARSGSGASSYGEFITEMNEALSRVILGQTMTSQAGPAGLGSNQAGVHKDVRDEIVTADSDMLCESFNQGPARWLTEWNFPGAAIPRVYRDMEDPEDLDTLAERDKKIGELGWELTDKAFAERYGEGYQRKAPPPELGGPAKLGPDGKPLPAPIPRLPAPGPEFTIGDARPLYVSRRVVNWAAIKTWAQGQGIKNLVDDPHVTILYSKTPVIWGEMGRTWGGESKTGNITVEPGGPREVDIFQADGPLVLYIPGIWELDSRHRDMIEKGASSDYPEYRAHITLSYDPGREPEGIEPYQGVIVLGPELFEDLEPNPETAFSADDMDTIERLAAAMLDPSAAVFSAMIGPIQARLKGVRDPQALRIALLEAAEKVPTERLARVMADAQVAVRATEEAGIGVAALTP
jgi:hypothetical protein